MNEQKLETIAQAWDVPLGNKGLRKHAGYSYHTSTPELEKAKEIFVDHGISPTGDYELAEVNQEVYRRIEDCESQGKVLLQVIPGSYQPYAFREIDLIGQSPE